MKTIEEEIRKRFGAYRKKAWDSLTEEEKNNFRKKLSQSQKIRREREKKQNEIIRELENS